MVKCRLKFNKKLLKHYTSKRRYLIYIADLQEMLWDEILRDPYMWEDFIYKICVKNTISNMSKKELINYLNI